MNVVPEGGENKASTITHPLRRYSNNATLRKTHLFTKPVKCIESHSGDEQLTRLTSLSSSLKKRDTVDQTWIKAKQKRLAFRESHKSQDKASQTDKPTCTALRIIVLLSENTISRPPYTMITPPHYSRRHHCRQATNILYMNSRHCSAKLSTMGAFAPYQISTRFNNTSHLPGIRLLRYGGVV